MTSKIALTSIAKGDNWLTAIALSAGYSYDETLYSQAIVGPSSAVIPVFAIHGKKDTSVLINGCCDHNTCCCNIYAPKCLSFMDSFNYWRKINRCSSSPDGKSVLKQDFTREFSKQIPVICFTAEGCLEQVRYCEFAEYNHSLGDLTPLITDFFVNNYERNNNKKINFKADSLKNGDSLEDDEIFPGTSPATNNVLVILFALIISIGFVVYFKHRMKQHLQRGLKT